MDITNKYKTLKQSFLKDNQTSEIPSPQSIQCQIELYPMSFVFFIELYMIE